MMWVSIIRGVVLAGLIAAPGAVWAQGITGFADDRFEPAGAGSQWMTGESLEYRGHLRPAAALVEDWAVNPIVAYVVTHGNRKADSEVLRKHVAESLPDIMVPSVVVTLAAFPLTPNGKVDRKALPAPPAGAATLAADASATPPVDDNERLVATIWTEELGRPVGRDDNFFEIGGHSLLAVKVFRRLTDATDVPLALTDVFRYPTVRAFAAYLGSATQTTAGAAATAPGAPTGTDRGAMRRRAMSRRGNTD